LLLARIVPKCDNLFLIDALGFWTTRQHHSGLPPSDRGTIVTDDFKSNLISFARTAISRAERVRSEEAAKQYLVLPMFQFLGYDPLNPDEVIPEAAASFSDKFKNRVDYAICIGAEPVMAVECKKTGDLSDGHRGELKGYFNAVQTVKLGVLTDGLVYELFSDTDSENMMDNGPFVTVDLAEVARERVTDQALDALRKLRKGTFDPADVGADAKRRIYVARYVEALESSFLAPTEAFQRSMMDLAEVEGRRTTKLVEEHAPLIQAAFEAFIDKKILERVGFASRQDIVKVQQSVPQQSPAEPVESAGGAQQSASNDGIITTETEMAIFDHVKSRLAFLVRDESLFRKVQQLQFVDKKTTFIIFYGQERKGRVLNFREGPNHEFRFEFPNANDMIETSDLFSIDKQLLLALQHAVDSVDSA